MLSMFIVIESLNPCGKFCLWALAVAITVSVAICQLVTCKILLFGKKVYYGRGTYNRRVSNVLNSHLFFDNLEYIST